MHCENNIQLPWGCLQDVAIIHNFIHPDGVAGNILCRLLTGGNFAWVGAGASVFTLVTIATERYFAVMYPFENKGKLSSRKLKVRKCNVIKGE